MPLNHILKKCIGRYKLHKLLEKNQPSNVYGWLQTVCKNEKELEILIKAVGIYSDDIGVEFGIEKCAMLIMKCEKQHMTEGTELPNQDKIKKLGEKETYKYSGVLDWFGLFGFMAYQPLWLFNAKSIFM